MLRMQSAVRIVSMVLLGTSLDPGQAIGAEPGSIEEARELLRARNLDGAEAVARQLLAEAEFDDGPESLQVAEVLDVLVESMWRSGRAHEPDVRPNAERAVAIKQAVLGAENSETAVSLRNLAIVVQGDGDLDLAESLHRRIIAIQTRFRGPQHPHTALALRDLGNVFLVSGRYEDAERLYRQALSIQESAPETEDRDLAITLNNLGNLLGRSGHYLQAQRMYERALAIKTTAVDSDSLDIAWSMNGLAILYEDMGNYIEAQNLYLRTLELRRQALGPKHIQVAQSLDNLANLYRQEGDYLEAMALTEQALAIGSEILGPDDLFVAVVRDNLAELLYLTGDLERAKTLRRQAVEKRRQVQGADHPDYAGNLVGLADLYAATDDREIAEQMYRDGLAIQEEQLGPTHPAVALSCLKLAQLLASRGRLEEAEEWNHRAVEIRRRTLGADHPLVGQALGEAALIEARMGREGEALEVSLEAETIGRDHLRLTARVLPERQVFRYAEVRSSGLDLGLTLLERRLDSADVERVWDALIRSRALVLDEMALRHQAISGAKESEVSLLALEVAEARRYLASTLLQGAEGINGSDYREQLAAAQRRKDDAERRLAAKSARFRREQVQISAGLDEVRQSLPESSALVAYVVYDRLNLRREANGSASRAGFHSEAGTLESHPTYFAFVLPGRERKPVAVPLAAAELIDTLVARWTAEVGRPPVRSQSSLAATGSGPARASEQVARDVGEALETTMWAPIESYLRDASRVFVVPDGALNLVSFAALPVGSDHYLIESGPAIHYLSAERDLVGSPTAAPPGSGLLVLGGALFDGEPEAAEAANQYSEVRRSAKQPSDLDALAVAGALTTEESVATRTAASTCGDFTSVRFEPLPASLPEVDKVIALWSSALGGDGESRAGQADSPAQASVVRMTGASADEATFKHNATGKQVIHLATHGFFWGKNCHEVSPRSRGIGGVASAAAVDSNLWNEANPLLLSGLAMAGANRRGERSGKSEDGILTAEEVASLELEGVEWAVLSACDTGVGEVTAGEGVLGLRRSFQIAGARTVIMSLWSVEDQSAAEFMSELYRGRFADQLSTLDAMHRATSTMLTRRRTTRQSTHPFYWAGFVAAGGWE